ncbi:MAG: ThiF family adenylyltransferase [Candidatus Solibacter sp.]
MPPDPVDSVDYSRLDSTAFPKPRMGALSVAVVGAGALGNEVIKSLGLIGIGRILVIDPDIVEPSNLTRSVFYSYYNSAGQNKAQVIADVCSKIFVNTNFNALPVEIADVGFQDLRGIDLLFSCVDSDLARLEIAYAATTLDLPVADAGLGAENYSHGRVTWFGGSSSACYSCMLSRQTRREILSLSGGLARSCWDPEVAGESGLPGTPMMASMVAAMQVDLGLRSLLGGSREESWSVEISIELTPVIERFSVRRSVSCPLHDRPATLVPAPGDASTVWELLQSVDGNDPVLVLDWPICSAASCEDCGHKWAPLRRLAFLRRAGECPACGSRHLREDESIRLLTRHSSWASTQLSQLGLPPHHLYTVRTGDTQ